MLPFVRVTKQKDEKDSEYEDIEEAAYEKAKQQKYAIPAEVDAASDVLNAYPKGPTGLTPDSVRAASQWREDKQNYDKAFAKRRAFNAVFDKTWVKKIKAERSAKYNALSVK